MDTALTSAYKGAVSLVDHKGKEPARSLDLGTGVRFPSLLASMLEAGGSSLSIRTRHAVTWLGYIQFDPRPHSIACFVSHPFPFSALSRNCAPRRYIPSDSGIAS